MAHVKELKLGKNIIERLEKSGHKKVEHVVNANIKNFKKKTGFSDKQIIDVISHAKRHHVKKHFDRLKGKEYWRIEVTKSDNWIYNILFIAGLTISFASAYTKDYDSLTGAVLLMFLSVVFRYFNK